MIDRNKAIALSTRALKLKESERLMGIGVGGVVAVAGGAAMHFLAGPGRIGIVAVVIGLVLVARALVRGARAVVIMEPTMVVLRFDRERRIPFHSIAKVAQLATLDVELTLFDGQRVLIAASRLDAEEGAWLRKALRKEVRLAAS